jgi:hypothetical protein
MRQCSSCFRSRGTRFGVHRNCRQRDRRKRGAKRVPRDIQQMLMVREEQDLGFLREFVQDPKARRGAFVVEIYEQVVRNEWHRLGIVEVILHRRDPKREIELVHRAVAHPGDGDMSSVLPDTGQLHVVICIELKPECLERAACQDREQFPGAFEQGRLLFSPVAINRPL